MSDSKHSEQDLLDVLRGGPLGVASQQDVERQREELLPWLEAQVAQLPERRNAFHKERRRRRFRYAALAGGTSMAAAAALTFFVLDDSVSSPTDKRSVAAARENQERPTGYATLVSGQVQSGTVELLSGSRLSHASRVTTGESEQARLRDSSGFEVVLQPSSEFSFSARDHKSTDQDTFVNLSRGAARFSVPHLPSGSTLSVITPSAHVTVIGTKFSVEVDEDSTCVKVEEGRVSVVSEGRQVFLSAGDSSGCDSNPTTSEPADRPAAIKTNNKPPAATTLADQNALLSMALSQERKGNLRQAEKAFQRLLRAYPNSPFLPEARAGLERVQESNASP